ncbi:uncharacterized protein PV09_00624 [Verruconis gallopava]|uniref:Amine oxidase n=1 Tax=Verruconis gallopava TaxID=253628 RepID=A0A0D2APQ2_9PEZI|nr:uncharacterized protein PV09_00624 [Verruconis gallopava]KIW08673.1 hypothetical protein PV09_00624 [Verruconis gallopava]
MASIPHPLQHLSKEETCLARDILKQSHSGEIIEFREISLLEPPKAELTVFLDLEHKGLLSASSPRPQRLAKCHYDTIGSDKIPRYNESIVDLGQKARIKHEVIPQDISPALTIGEFEEVVKVINASPMYKAALAELQLPDYLEPIIEPWPYGSLEPDDDPKGRYFQGLVFATDKRSGNPDTNFYPFPVPLIPVVDYHKREVVRIIKLATGGIGEPVNSTAHPKNPMDHCVPAEYIPELLPGGVRQDLKELNVVQPNGPSFKVTDDSLVEWQKWRFRVSFTPREGAVIHDVHYDGRSVLYRLSMSEMTVPYADAWPPFHRKQAFDFGEGGAGACTNNLALGCDCLGHIKYFDSVILKPNGDVLDHPNVICLHEQDNGIGWKHTNWRTGRAVVTRNRELVVQFIITLANYEYVFAYKFNQSGGIDIETRATGIVSCVNIDAGKISEYGNVVNPGVLAQNHQHIFAIRIDPAIDGHKNTVVQEESLPVPMNAKTNPNGNFYQVVRTPLKQSQWVDAMPQNNRVFKIVNENIKNPISGRPVGYKLVPPPTQLLLADKRSKQAKRAAFAQHHLWVTKYRDQELWAAGPYLYHSSEEIGGVQDMVARGDDIQNEDVVLWSVFGLTHNPRVEDWPVMPVEIHQVSLRPADFFTANPSLDVPSNRNLASKLENGSAHTNGNAQTCCHRTNTVANEN